MPALRWLRAVLLGAVLAGSASAASADPPVAIDISVRPVALNLDNLAQRQVGKLIYRGGIAMNARDTRFGGWSGLRLNDDGTRLTAISDRGSWFEARIVHDAAES